MCKFHGKISLNKIFEILVAIGENEIKKKFPLNYQTHKKLSTKTRSRLNIKYLWRMLFDPFVLCSFEKAICSLFRAKMSFKKFTKATLLRLRTIPKKERCSRT